jgi:uncharacterized RDD family membrane protein YckC
MATSPTPQQGPSAPWGPNPYTPPTWGPPQPPPPAYPGAVISPPAFRPQLAPYGPRLGARLIDSAVVGAGILIIALAVTLLQASAGEESTVTVALGVIAWTLLAALILGYEPWMTRRYGATLGKRACGLRVVRLADGRPLSTGQAIGRLWITIPMVIVPLLSILNIAFCLWDTPNRQCLHDKFASSVVVTKEGRLTS